MMNSPPEALSPSPSTPSSDSPSGDEIALPTPAHSTPPPATSSPTQSKRRLPPSSSSSFAGREGRENKSRRREREVVDERAKRIGSWETVRMAGEVHGVSPGGRTREDFVDMHMIEYVRNAYGDPLDDAIFQKNKTS